METQVMKKFINYKYLTFFAAILAIPSMSSAASLLEVYQQALQSDPLIHEAEARRLATEEATPQALALLFPQVQANAAWNKTTADGEQIIFDTTSGVTTIGFTSESTAKSWDVGLRQTLFRWDQVVGLKQAGKRVAQAGADYEAAQQDLIIRVAARYFDVLGAEDVLTSIHADRLAIARQLEQAKQRFEVGLIAITDVQESQAAHDQSIADEIGAKRTLATAREFLREITGQYVATLSAPVDNLPLATPNPADEASWIDQAMAQNLQLVSSRLGEEVARHEISFRRTGYYPTLDLVAARNFSDRVGTTQFDGTPVFPADSNSTADSISVQFSLPIFTGGRTTSRVREAIYLHRASMEQLQRVSRETERATRDAYLGVLAEISRVKALKQSVASSRTALEATQAGFDVGTRTIVDVLISQRALYTAITNYYRSRYAYIANVLLLKQAAGSLQVQDLEEIDRWLVDRQRPEDVIAAEEAKASGES
jgi:outer membrane protein